MFLVVSSIIIEKGKKERGEKSIFNKIMIKHNNENSNNYKAFAPEQNSNNLSIKTIKNDSVNCYYSEKIISYLYISPEIFLYTIQ